MGCGVSRRNVVPERGGSPKENGSARGGWAKENGSVRGGSAKENGSARGGSAKENGFTPVRSPVRADVVQQQQAREQRRKMIQERQLRTISAAQELSGRYLEDRDRLSVNGTSHLSSRTSSPHGSRANSKRVHFEKGSLRGEGDSPVPSSSGVAASSLRQEPKAVAVR